MITDCFSTSPRRQAFAALFALSISLSASLASAATYVKDAAGMFSPQAAQQAEQRLGDLQKKSGKFIIVETMDVPPPAVQARIVADASQRNAAILQLAGERAAAAGADVYVLINKTPGNLQIAEKKDLQRGGLPSAERARIGDAMLAAFKSKQFDTGLTTGVSMFGDALGGGMAGTVVPSTTPPPLPTPTAQPSPRRDDPTPAPPVSQAPGGVSDKSILGGGCCTIIGIGLLIVIVVTVFRKMTGGGRGPTGPTQFGTTGPGGYPPQQGGYPPQGGYPQQGYPQQQQRGGGFGTGIAGGLLGGVLGSVIGNRMSHGSDGGHSDPNPGGGGAFGGGGHRPDGDSGGGGGDF